MNNEFVSFEVAKKLKEKGFREKCFATYTPYGGIFKFNEIDTDKIALCDLNIKDFGKLYNYYKDSNIDAPAISQVLKWFRDEKNIYCLPWFEQGVDMWFYAICKPTSGCEFPEFMSKSDYDTYEEAAIAGIEYVLDNLI
ncbi:MAG: hypothetical protein J6Q60_01245 [Bacteroidaceae bacterium]|nr:hypothetical protein [Bacteroidaceae bacterium]